MKPVLYAVALLSSLAATTAHALLLINPDLSGLADRVQPQIQADLPSNRLYLYGFGTRIHGVPFADLARLNASNNELDIAWRPEGTGRVLDLATGANGDVFVVSLEKTRIRRSLLQISASSPAVVTKVFDEIFPLATDPQSANADFGAGVHRIARGSDRWLYFVAADRLASGDLSFRVGRVDTIAGAVDSAWTLPAPHAARISVTSDNDLVIYATLDDSRRQMHDSRLARYATSESTPRLLCSREDPGRAYTEAIDDGQGSVFLGLTDGAYPTGGKPITVTRVNRDCSMPRLPSQVSGSVNALGFFVANGRAVVYERQLIDSYLSPATLDLIPLDSDGTRLASVTLAVADYSYATRPSVLGDAIYIAARTAITTVDASSLQIRRSAPLPLMGSPSTQVKIARLESGEVLMSGTFETMLEGRAYTNLLKLRRNGAPDTTWTPRVRFVGDAIPAPRGGVLLSGTFTNERGEALAATHALVNYATAAITYIDWSRLGTFGGAVYDGDRYIYASGVASGQMRPEIRRFDVAQRAFDPDWRIELPNVVPGGAYRYNGLRHVDRGALWIMIAPQNCFGGQCGSVRALRYDIEQGKVPRATLLLPVYWLDNGRFWVREPYAYSGDFRYALDGNPIRTDVPLELTPSSPASGWRLEDRGYQQLVSVTDTHAYARVGGVILRARLDGSGATESDWKIDSPLGASGDIVVNDADIAPLPALLLNSGWDPFDPTSESSLSIAPLDPRGNSPREVVEYYHAGIDRYFITGVPSEQAALDANPSLGLARTGMRFMAKEAYVVEAGLNPVCRFYSPPNAGGSNSHFFAQGETCQWGRLWSNLRPEGYDFSVVPPTGGSCPSSAPVPVTRVFNNRAASKNGNHRYVVSTTSKLRMLARGWVDEGVVFCASAVVDTPS